ncbi:hypothetical protein HHK36_011063 [Tetracentron sinense]|uniref:C2H2-type domain-containing protein n=1 Tax=Tetracentron sinense TaxID=13715 RepID=A0A834ZC58_TETSI|nr:hypothetical protein HHK36_011063 [Tetracentron sinense]
METDPPTPDNSDQAVCTSSEDKGPSHVRYYECIFCKRGFSSAQALGGHMNIHRKHRVELKHPSNENQLYLDITKKNPSYPPISTYYQSLTLESNEEKSCTFLWPFILSREDDAIVSEDIGRGKLRQLPLFVEKPSTSIDLNSNSHFGGHQERMIQSSHVSPPRVELDLELRLGPDPQDTSSEVTKEFF